jgi:phenylacetate-CoA ligase
MTIRHTPAEHRRLAAFRWRAMHQFGLRPSDHVARITFTAPSTTPSAARGIRALQGLGLYPETPIDCLLPVEDIVRVLRDCRADVVRGFTGPTWRVAQAFGAADRRAARPRFVAVGSEPLTPLARRQIAEGFGAPVLDLYGSHEFNLIAWECRESGEYHVCDDSVIVEVLDNGRPVPPGGRGEVVATSLHAFAMPFIRYRLGDAVTRGSLACPCGQPFSTLRAIEGRTLDWFTLPDGRRVDPYAVVLDLHKHFLDRYPWVRQHQLVQEREDRIVLRLATVREPVSGDLAAVEASGRALFGPGVDFHVVLVTELPLEPGGKFGLVRSLVRPVEGAAGGPDP